MLVAPRGAAGLFCFENLPENQNMLTVFKKNTKTFISSQGLKLGLLNASKMPLPTEALHGAPALEKRTRSIIYSQTEFNSQIGSQISNSAHLVTIYSNSKQAALCQQQSLCIIPTTKTFFLPKKKKAVETVCFLQSPNVGKCLVCRSFINQFTGCSREPYYVPAASIPQKQTMKKMVPITIVPTTIPAMT